MSGVNSNTIYDARLTNGYFGTVELLTYRGWRPLCRYRYWSSSRSRVLCRQYGLEYSSSSKGTNYIRNWSECVKRTIMCLQTGYMYYIIMNAGTTSAQSSSLNSLAFFISCSGTESELSQCSYSFSGEFSSCSYGLVTVSCAACKYTI